MSKQKNLKDEVISHIQKQIKFGNISPGDIINEVALSNELNVSRTPAREALLQLVANNILEKVPRKGYTPIQFTKKQKDNIHSIIGALDALAAILAMEHLTDHDLLKMQETVDKLDIAIRYKNYDDYFLLQEDFHNIYINKCENPPLISMLNTIRSGPIQYTYTNEDMDKLFVILAESNDQHRRIIELFKERNGAELEKYLKYTHWYTFYPEFI
jgi:DNA-binding GntR family transcriptional regulator